MSTTKVQPTFLVEEEGSWASKGMPPLYSTTNFSPNKDERNGFAANFFRQAEGKHSFAKCWWTFQPITCILLGALGAWFIFTMMSHKVCDCDAIRGELTLKPPTHFAQQDVTIEVQHQATFSKKYTKSSTKKTPTTTNSPTTENCAEETPTTDQSAVSTEVTPLRKACSRIGGVYYVNNGIGSCYTVIYIEAKYTTARKSCIQLSGYNAHLAYWRDGAALQLVNKSLISTPGQYFIGEVLVNKQWTDQDSNGINGAPFNMEYMCSHTTCATSMVGCLPKGKFGALTTNGHGTSWSGLCMGTFGQGGNPANGPGMYYICEYEAASFQTDCNRIGGIYYENNGTGSCYTVIKTETIYTTAQKSCTQLSDYNGHLAYWRDGVALQLVNENLITQWGQYFIGEVFVNNQWTNQDAKGINGALFNMNYMCSAANCSAAECLSRGTFGALSTVGPNDSYCMGKFNQKGNSGHGMFYICEYENM